MKIVCSNSMIYHYKNTNKKFKSLEFFIKINLIAEVVFRQENIHVYSDVIGKDVHSNKASVLNSSTKALLF